ncbi:FtsW/RodA/SpoVE family cell cycle protein [Falsibacillus pallidus]|uniref:Probable peptidoglycan glycosyltransferase FtsW n=1 Tax=Falsibacillus pallidus TaxID=493781 RepID=A0A370GV90_9BACI|nr:FtsW/RodA/SpoVE family cell cycle protein [Falsibacillus pallidus]RDI47595.1 cell division-specific peptidoglycan biosynthesis regulator FtsW [Falsibacillus pallidus]
MFKKILKSYDYSLIVVYFLLCIFGLVMVYSASMVWAVQQLHQENDFFYNKQKINLILSFIFFIGASLFPYKAYISKKFIGGIVLLSLFGLGSLFVFGHISNNAQSWIKLGTRMIQPAEFVKLTVILYLSAVYAKKESYINKFNKGVVPPIVFLFVVCLLVAVQPDFGTAGIIFVIGVTIIICSGMNMKNLMKLALLGLMLAVIASPFVLVMKDKIFSKERMSRIEVFLDPFQYEQGDGYQVVNSYIAIGSGGITGQGLGQSVQKLGYLPEPHTDFIMAVVAEELGVFGVAFVLLGLGFIVLKGIFIGMKCKDTFGSLLAIGISSMIAIQSIINLGGVSGFVPLTGVPLPFISYGGSSILLLSIAMGVLVNVAMFVRYEQKYKANKGEPVPEQNKSTQLYRVKY